jgi:hypothetical protein
MFLRTTMKLSQGEGTGTGDDDPFHVPSPRRSLIAAGRGVGRGALSFVYGCAVPFCT